MKVETGSKCGHEPCHCAAGVASPYCSDACERQAKAEPGEVEECSCGHAGCQGGMRVPDDPSGVRGGVLE